MNDNGDEAIRLCTEIASMTDNQEILLLEKLSGKAEIPNTTISLKDRFWKPILKAMTGKESTTKMDTKEPDAIYQTACRILSTNFGIVPPEWPSNTRKTFDDN